MQAAHTVTYGTLSALRFMSACSSMYPLDRVDNRSLTHLPKVKVTFVLVVWCLHWFP